MANVVHMNTTDFNLSDYVNQVVGGDTIFKDNFSCLCPNLANCLLRLCGVFLNHVLKYVHKQAMLCELLLMVMC